jgi:thiol peroxidase
MKKMVFFENRAYTLSGRIIRPLSTAPEFTAVSENLDEVSLSDFGDIVKVISFFLSIDTPVCDIQIREFNKYAAGRGEGVVFIGISRDLPFALKRFAETFNIHNMRLISDHRYGSFGVNYGVLIKELSLLARGVVILDRGNTIRYTQLVRELANQLDYDEIFRILDEVMKNPVREPDGGETRSTGSGGERNQPLLREDVDSLLSRVQGWELVDGKKLVKELRFKTFADARFSLDLLSVVAEERRHHPSFVLNYNRLKITLTTHSAGGLTDNDFLMASIIDEMIPER